MSIIDLKIVSDQEIYLPIISDALKNPDEISMYLDYEFMSFPLAHLILEAAFMTEDMIKINLDSNSMQGWRYYNEKKN